MATVITAAINKTRTTGNELFGRCACLSAAKLAGQVESGAIPFTV